MNPLDQGGGRGRTLHGVGKSEHAHLCQNGILQQTYVHVATKYIKKFREEYLILWWNKGTTDMGFGIDLHMFKRVNVQGSPELALGIRRLANNQFSWTFLVLIDFRMYFTYTIPPYKVYQLYNYVCQRIYCVCRRRFSPLKALQAVMMLKIWLLSKL